MPTDTPLARVALTAKTLGHSGRLRILAMLRQHTLSVCQIASVLNVAPSTASGYLLELRRAGFVTEQRRGKWVYYRLANGDPNDALLRVVLLVAAGDPQLGADAVAARKLSGTPMEAVCAAAGSGVEGVDACASPAHS